MKQFIKKNFLLIVVFGMALLVVGFNVYSASITTILETDYASSSRAVINTNFSNLNTNKLEVSDYNATTTLPNGVDTDDLTEGSTNLYQDSEITNWIDNVTLLTSGNFTFPYASSTGITASGDIESTTMHASATSTALSFCMSNGCCFYEDSSTSTPNMAFKCF